MATLGGTTPWHPPAYGAARPHTLRSPGSPRMGGCAPPYPRGPAHGGSSRSPAAPWPCAPLVTRATIRRVTEIPGTTGARLRLARQARGFSQLQLAGMALVSRQAISAVESGYSDPSLRVALALAHALGMSVEELFGPGDPAEPVPAIPVAPSDGS